jgi:hypothetical protein
MTATAINLSVSFNGYLAFHRLPHELHRLLSSWLNQQFEQCFATSIKNPEEPGHHKFKLIIIKNKMILPTKKIALMTFS